MPEHHDSLDDLNKHIPLRDKLIAAHKSVSELFPFVARIAIAIYDSKTTLLKTFVHSSGDDNPLEHYQALLEDGVQRIGCGDADLSVRPCAGVARRARSRTRPARVRPV